MCQSSYTLEQGGAKCYECPENAYCEEGWQVIPNRGYWKPGSLSLDIYPCFIQEACEGGLNSTCAEGYKGILCKECVGELEGSYFARSGANRCKKCES